jgi:hypothetical protein
MSLSKCHWTLNSFSFRRLAGFFALCNLIVCTPALSESKPRGDANAGKALVYLIQPEGSRRHLFSGQEWLGVVDKDAYIFTHLAPGEHFIWVDGGRIFGAVFFAAGSTNYVEISAKDITALSPEKGESMLAQTGSHSEPVAGDRVDSYKHLKRYRKARKRAAKAGLFEPCRFAGEKRAGFHQRVESGDAGAAHILGNLYWYGECVERDFGTAMGWYRRAAEHGHTGAAVTLGNIYFRGQNVTGDPTEAAKWYHVAAEQGDLISQRRLAEMHQNGNGVEKSTTEAIKWYRKAAREQNDHWSLLRLEEIDPEIQEIKRLQTEADARAAEAEKQSRAERLQRIKKRRLAVINSKYGDLGVTVIPLLHQPKLEQPSRKKPVDDGSSWDNGLAYSLPPEIALGVLALGVVFNAIEKAVDSRLSDSEKQLINKSAGSLTQLLSGDSVARDLKKHIVDSGRLTGEESVFADMDYQRGEHDGDGAVSIDRSTIAAVVEVETSGIGLVLAEKRYRPSQFVMASRIRVLSSDDGTVLKDRSLCYASSDSPEFSAWAVDQNKRLRAELDTAYAATAETLLLILAGEAYSTSAESNQLCDTLTEIVEHRLATPNEPER